MLFTNTMGDVDRGYSILLSHLHKPTSTLPLSSLQSLIAHFLAHTQTPTPLSAILVSSPLFRPFSHSKLTTLGTALRHAVHAKHALLDAEDARGGIFRRGVRPGLADWVRAVVRGFTGGQGLMRFVVAGGVLLGLEDISGRVGMGLGTGGARARAEEEVVVALAEVMELYGGTGWEWEFRKDTADGDEDPLSLALVYAGLYLPHVLPDRIKALPLSTLSSHLLTTIDHTFLSGVFIPPAPLDSLTTSLHFASIAATAKLTAGLFPLLVDARPQEGWPAMYDALTRLETLTAAVQRAWVHSAFATVEDDNDLAPDAREQAKTLWTVLKTLLFTTIMVAQSIISTTVYNAPPPSSQVSPFILAQTTLRTLFNLAFVISQFGGVASTAESGFTELKRLFYMALDVLAAKPPVAEAFVVDLLHDPHPSSISGLAVGPTQSRANLAYALAAIEQLVPVLSLHTIEHVVFPVCMPSLNDAVNRETYESAHSVVLATFSAHPATRDQPDAPNFVERMVPFYAKCLLDNASEGRLSTGQLCLAYAAVVRACEPPLAQYSVDLLVSDIEHVSSSRLPLSLVRADHVHRLRLALVSSIPSLPLMLLPGTLAAVVRNIDQADGEREKELVLALYSEIVEHIGDGEKEYAMRWWEEWKVRGQAGFIEEGYKDKGKGRTDAGVLARL
ncbi:hypothetical protein FA95DRAFT_900902 [Auriscalpium vulgare]|uniref:Uncharacterized protein n=1 Tax=Auriscalpium vulgare TaxID=40419 RepID=A0ACB8R8Q9_9AGAM|nr:hypothetical protein FA95DRAFT_900902 [Auriscalpium vulgare]